MPRTLVQPALTHSYTHTHFNETHRGRPANECTDAHATIIVHARIRATSNPTELPVSNVIYSGVWRERAVRRPGVACVRYGLSSTHHSSSGLRIVRRRPPKTEMAVHSICEWMPPTMPTPTTPTTTAMRSAYAAGAYTYV